MNNGELVPFASFRFVRLTESCIDSDGDSIGDAFGNAARPAGGGGLRYLLAREYGLHVGLDVAQGPEETIFYVQVGHAWARD